METFRVAYLLKIGRGTHLMHLETMRLALWRKSVGFLLGEDKAAIPQMEESVAQTQTASSPTKGTKTMADNHPQSEAIPGYNPGSPEVARRPSSPAKTRGQEVRCR
jgi:hypothetical protein